MSCQVDHVHSVVQSPGGHSSGGRALTAKVRGPRFNPGWLPVPKPFHHAHTMYEYAIACSCTQLHTYTTVHWRKYAATTSFGLRTNRQLDGHRNELACYGTSLAHNCIQLCPITCNYVQLCKLFGYNLGIPQTSLNQLTI